MSVRKSCSWATLTLLTSFLCWPVLSTAHGQGKSKPSPPPPPTPNFSYKFTWIHDHDKHRWSEVRAFNQAGVVLGLCGVSDLNGERWNRCFIWTEESGIVYLGEVPTVNEDGDSLTEARWFNPDWPNLGGHKEFWFAEVNDINDTGQIVGYGWYLDGYPDIIPQHVAFRWTPPDTEGGHALLEHIDVPAILGEQTTPRTINNSGDVAGNFVGSDGSWRVFLLTEEDGQVHLGSYPSNSYTHVLSDRYGAGPESIQLIVSGYRGGLAGGSRALRFTAQIGEIESTFNVQDLGTLRSDNLGSAGAGDMNHLGEVVGAASTGSTPRSFPESAYRYDDVGGMRDLGSLSTHKDYKKSWAFGINDFSETVGVSHFQASSATRPFLHTDQYGMLDLTLLTTDEPTSTSLNPKYFRAFRINNSGDIVGPDIGNYNFDPVPPKAFLLRRYPQ